MSREKNALRCIICRAKVIFPSILPVSLVLCLAFACARTLLAETPSEVALASEVSLPELENSQISQPHDVILDALISNEGVNGWSFLAQQLVRIGVPSSQVVKVLGDRRMPQRTPVTFKLKPRETEQMYTSFTLPSRLEIAKSCLKNHHESFVRAEGLFQVSRYVLAALLLVETQCGRFVGNSLILDRLARVSSVSEPQNIDFNFNQLRASDPTVTREEVAARAQYLEDTFLPEVKALLEVARIKNVDVFKFKGSVAGAFGLPQFLPTSYLKYAVDGSGDDFADLFDPKDAIPSVGNYLLSFGWNEESSAQDKKKVLWHYNRSDAYGDAVLKVSILLRESYKKSA